jgi:hypothetical protein
VKHAQRALLAALLGGIFLSGCGDGSGDDARPQRLPADALATVDTSQAAIRSYCRHVRLYLIGERDPPGPAEYERAQRAVTALVEVAREAPEAQYRNQGTMRQLLGDSAENLEGTNCSRDLVRVLDEGLRTLPPP